MNTKPEQLNEKIAEWLGPVHTPILFADGSPTGEEVIITPNFTTSQDTHGPIKEKLIKDGGGTVNAIKEISYHYYGDGIVCTIRGHFRVILCRGDKQKTESLAFCLAVEKIIDGE